MVAVIVMNHSAMTLLILVCSSDMNTKIFLFRPRKYQYCQETIRTWKWEKRKHSKKATKRL